MQVVGTTSGARQRAFGEGAGASSVFEVKKVLFTKLKRGEPGLY